MPDFTRFFSGQQRPSPHPSEMVLAPTPRAPIQLDTRAQFSPVLADGRAFAARDLARADMGQAVQGIGGHLKDLALKQMEAINIRKVSDAQDAMTAAEADMMAAITKEQDETKWATIAESHIGKAKDRIGSLTLSPVAKAQVRSDLSRWEIHAKSQLTTESAKHSFARAQNAILKKTSVAIEKGDRAAMESNLRGGVDGGYIFPEDADLARLKFDTAARQREKQALHETRTAGLDRFSQSLMADPWQTLNDLKSNALDDPARSSAFPELDAADRLRAIAGAQEEIRSRQREEVSGEGGIRDRIVTGDMDDIAINDAGQALRLGAEEVEKLKKFRRDLADAKVAAGPLDRKAVGALIGRIESYKGDDKSDPTAAEWGQLVQEAEVLTAAGGKEGDLTRGVLMQKLYQRHPGAERRTKKDMPEGIEKNFNAYLEAFRNDGAFGVPEYRSAPKTIATAEGPVKSDSEFVLEPNPAAAVRYVEAHSRLWNELQEEFKADPVKLTVPGALEEWVSKRLKGYRAGAQVQKLRAAPSDPGPNADLFPTTDNLETFLK